jgi:hypothetical protein
MLIITLINSGISYTKKTWLSHCLYIKFSFTYLLLHSTYYVDVNSLADAVASYLWVC